MNTPVTVTYRFSELNIDPGQIEKLIGYDPGTAPEPIPEMISSALESSGQYADIKGTYLTTEDFSIHKYNFELNANRQNFHIGKLITHYINKAEQFVFFILTAGKGIEQHARKLITDSDPMLGYIYDVIGSLTVEITAEKTLRNIEDNVKENGLMTSNPYSPGYCGWPVTDQKNLFNLFNGNTCGISLSDTYLMDPIKSVSGIIGIGKNIKKQPYSCAICDLKNCIYRDKR